jgi:hypothetical protein
MVGPPRKRLLAASSLDDHAAKEDAQANQHEAEFSRLRAALGLMNKASTEGKTTESIAIYIEKLTLTRSREFQVRRRHASARC